MLNISLINEIELFNRRYKAYQEDDKLNEEAGKIKQVAKDIMQRIKDKELKWSPNGKTLIGNLTFTDNEGE